MRWTPLLVLAGLVALAACTDHPTTPTAPEPDGPELAPGVAAASGRMAGQERLARRLALALNQPGVRQELLAALDASPHPEGKVHFQFVARTGIAGLHRALANAAADGEPGLDQDLTDAATLELYFPVPAHRARWRGAGDLLVGTAVTDADQPVGFDRTGRPVVLSRDRAPDTPVLMLVPAEQRFATDGATLVSCAECLEGDDAGSGLGGGTTGSSTGSSSTTGGGLYMTHASFTGTFESWFKGSPEFEVHVLGPASSATTLSSLQCAGEHAGGPYTYDQNDKSWTGSVLLFSQAQLDQIKVKYPSTGLRILVLEDDDGACAIKTQENRLTEMLRLIDEFYRYWTGGIDKTVGLQKYFRAATMFQQVVNSVASFINSNDDIVGTAIEDVIAGVSWPGTNWIVKNEQNISNGGLRLELR